MKRRSIFNDLSIKLYVKLSSLLRVLKKDKSSTEGNIEFDVKEDDGKPGDESVADSDSDTNTGETINDSSTSLLKITIDDEFKNRTQKLFEDYLIKNRDFYVQSAASYFATLVTLGVIQSEQGSVLQAKHISAFDSLEDILSLVTLVGVDEDKEKYEYNDSKFTLEGVLRSFIDEFIRIYFEYFVTEPDKEGVAYIDSVIPEGYKGKEDYRQKALELLKDSCGELYFILLRANLFNVLRNKKPYDLFKQGEDQANLVNSLHRVHLEHIDKENQELYDSIVRVNVLWLKILTAYKEKYKEPLPKGRVNDTFYDKRLVKVLNSLEKEGITEEQIRELSVLDNKLELSVIRKLETFSYPKGVSKDT